jgi:Terminase RNaseH-like domain
VVKEESDWKEELERLLELGERLDLESWRQGSWRSGPKPGEIWKPTCRDAWIEETLKIRPKVGRPIPFQLNPVQRQYSRTCGKRNIVLKARQVGITSYIAARFFVQTITRGGTLTMQVARDRESAEEIFRIVHRFWNNLPEQWQKGMLKTSHSSARELVFPRLDSTYTVTSADENAGRGRTIQNLHCTEVSRWGREGGEALASLRAAVVPGGEIVLESTANGAWGQFYEEWQRAEETGYRQHFFPWWYEESYVAEAGPSLLLLTEEETALVKDHGLTAGQIAWRRQQWASFRGRAVQEFAEDAVSCFRASGECAFELEAVEQAERGAVEPLQVSENRRLRIWLPAQPGREYVIGADPAGGGVEGDYSCAEVIDRESGTQCAEWHGHSRPMEFAQRLVKLGKEYNTALLAVERNNHGSGVLVHLRNLEYPRVFMQNKEDGWLTSAVSRPAMIEGLGVALIHEPWLFRSSRLLKECRTFVRDVDGNTGAAPGSHDDCVLAMAIAWAARKAEAGRGMAGGVAFDSLERK